MDCFGDIESYGRRRRRAASATDTDIQWDNNYYYYKVSSSSAMEEEEEEEGEEDGGPPVRAKARPRPRPRPRRRAAAPRTPRFLPEHVALGLRLTVGEEVNQKPFLPSSAGRPGHFPESAPFTSTEGSALNGDSDVDGKNAAYYPALNGEELTSLPDGTFRLRSVASSALNV